MSKTSASRINISLELPESGATQHKELPLKLLVLSNLSGQESSTPLHQRRKLTVDKQSLDTVMAQLQPHLDLKVKVNGVAQCLQLNFHSMQDFSPDHLVQQIPALKLLLAKRYLLNDLKSQLMSNPVLFEQLRAFVKNKQRFAELQQQVKQKVKQRDCNNL